MRFHLRNDIFPADEQTDIAKIVACYQIGLDLMPKNAGSIDHASQVFLLNDTLFFNSEYLVFN
jgi:hypothetical protein